MTTFPKISCLCPTRGRFETLRQSISFFLLQDYPNKELIIFNNHEQPITPHPKLIKQNIKVINAGSYEGKSMEKIYADTMKYISDDAEFVSIWDDDDIYFPWHLSSNIEKLINSEKTAIRSSYGYWQDIHSSMKDDYVIVQNTLEASMIVRKDKIFFSEDECDKSDPRFTHPHTSWVTDLSNKNEFLYNDDEITACFRWGYGKTYYHLQSSGPHKNSHELGLNTLLKPTAVQHLFFDLLEKTYLTIHDKKITSFTHDLKSEFSKKLFAYDIDKFEHIEKYTVWMYWNDINPQGFIKLCRESIIQNTYAEVCVLNDETVKNYNLPEHFYSLNSVHRADYIRIFLLKNFGGFWFNADTYVLGDLDEYYFRHLIRHETVFPWEYDVVGNMTTPIFSSKPFGIIIKYALKYIDEYLKNDPAIGWSGIGINGILKSVNDFKHRGDGYFFGLPKIAKFGYNNHLIDEWKFENLLTSELNMIIFHWSQIGNKIHNELDINLDDSLEEVKEKIINKYPNFSVLFEKQNLKYYESV